MSVSIDLCILKEAEGYNFLNLLLPSNLKTYSFHSPAYKNFLHVAKFPFLHKKKMILISEGLFKFCKNYFCDMTEHVSFHHQKRALQSYFSHQIMKFLHYVNVKLIWIIHLPCLLPLYPLGMFLITLISTTGRTTFTVQPEFFSYVNEYTMLKLLYFFLILNGRKEKICLKYEVKF